MSRARAALALAAVWLSAPAGAVTPEADVPANAIVADLPFLDTPERNRVLVDLAPAGTRPFRLLLDTGATDTVLTPRYARELGVTIRRHRDRPNERETSLGRTLRFWIDTESSDSVSRTGFEYGLLGGEFLAEYVLDIDFAKRRVRFLDPQRFKVPESSSAEDEAVLPLKIVSNRPHVKLEVEGKTVDVLLDTGAPFSLLLSGASAKRAGYEWQPVAQLRVGGVLGPIESYLCEARSLALGRFEFAPAPLVVAPKGAYNQGGNTDSALGYEALAHFHMRIDYPRKRLWLRRTNAEPLAWFGMPWAAVRGTGLLATLGEPGIVVDAVLPGTPAEKLGLVPGDAIALAGDGDAKARLTALLARIERGERVTVVRDVNGIL
ncbi:MAG: aspartyl protease family protein [Myxococcota bacterium]